MRRHRRFALDILIVVIYTLLYGWALGAFRGFPKGDDAYGHLTRIRFLLDNWPHVSWYPNWHCGFPLYLWYGPLPHYLAALAVKVTNWSIEFSLNFLYAVSVSMMGVGLYGLSYEITKNHDAALVTSLLTCSLPPLWGLVVFGGPYGRIVALIFLPLSAWSTLRYAKNLRNGSNLKMSYLCTVFLTVFGFVSHLQVGAFILITTLLILIFSIEKRRQSVFHAFKIFVPVFLLSTFFYLPFFISSPLQFFGSKDIGGLHTPGPVPLTYLIPPQLLSPLILPIILIVVLIVKYRKVPLEYFASRTLRAVGVILLLLFIYAFTRIPPQLYVFSPYDSTFFLSIYLMICGGILLGGIFKNLGPKSVSLSIQSKVNMQRVLLGVLLFGIVVSATIQFPMVQSLVKDRSAESVYSGYYCTQQLVKVDGNEKNFRFAHNWRAVAGWFNYKYDVPQTYGEFVLGSVHRTRGWNQWFSDAVWARKNNYEETNYLLDWHAVKWFLVAYPHYNYQKFLERSSYYSFVSKLDTPTLGTMYEFAYRFATPIVSATNTTTLLVIGKEAAYDSFFRSLAYIDYDSRCVIPIRGSEYIDDYALEELRKFDVVFLYGHNYHSYDKAWILLQEYVENGGGLIIGTGYSSDSNASYIPPPSPVNKTMRTPLENGWNLTSASSSVTDWIDFSLFSPAEVISVSFNESVQPWARTVLWNHGQPTVVVGEYDNGRVVWSGLNLPSNTVAYKNSMESFFLSRIIDWASKIPERFSSTTISADESAMDWSVSWTTPYARGSIAAVYSIKKEGDYSLRLGYNFSDPINDDQVNYFYNPPGVWNWTDKDLFGMWFYGDNSSHRVIVYLEEEKYRNFYWFEFYINWNGWKQIVYPFSQMNKNGPVDLANIDNIEIVIDDDPDAFGDAKWHYVYIDDISVGAIRRATEKYEWALNRPNPERVIVTINETCNGVLFKECYFENWHAFLADDGAGTQSLSIYRAGPDFMYIHIPKETTFPAEVVFEYKLSLIEKASYLTSISTLAFLVLYAFGLPLKMRVAGVIEKLKRIMRKKNGSI